MIYSCLMTQPTSFECISVNTYWNYKKSNNSTILNTYTSITKCIYARLQCKIIEQVLNFTRYLKKPLHTKTSHSEQFNKTKQNHNALIYNAIQSLDPLWQTCLSRRHKTSDFAITALCTPFLRKSLPVLNRTPSFHHPSSPQQSF